MAIGVWLDVMLARRKMTSRSLAARIEIAEHNLSTLRSGRVRERIAWSFRARSRLSLMLSVNSTVRV